MKATNRVKPYGGAAVVLPAKETVLDRLARHITPQPNGCWSWNGKPVDGGYAVTGVGGGAGQSQFAHRRVYEALFGVLPDDIHLHHECGNKGCCNYQHLALIRPGDHSRYHAAMRAMGAEVKLDDYS